jgi:hypothetical protein
MALGSHPWYVQCLIVLLYALCVGVDLLGFWLIGALALSWCRRAAEHRRARPDAGTVRHRASDRDGPR